MDCPRFHELLDDYLADRLDAVDRNDFRAHLQSCDSCRAAAAVIEPTLLFAALPKPRVSERDVEACVTAVTARIRHERLERRLAPRRVPWMAAAASIIILLGAGILWRTGDTAPAGPGSPIPDFAAAGNAPPPQVEIESGNPDMRVYQFADGTDGDAAVVFIVDEGLEL